MDALDPSVPGRLPDRDREPLLSVIVPAFNAEATITDAIRSALAQSEPNLEVIVVDDGSTDRTAELVAGIADPRVRLRSQSNAGPSRARNAGIAASRAAWVALLDADDRWEPDRARSLLDVAASGRADMVADDLRLVDEDGTENGTFFGEIGLVATHPLLVEAGDYLSGRIGDRWTPRPGILKPILRKAFLHEQALGYSEDIRGPEDYLLYCQLLLSGARFLITPEVGYVYVRYGNSLSLGNPEAFLGQEVRMLERLIAEPALPDGARAPLGRWLGISRRMWAAARIRSAFTARQPLRALGVATRQPAGIVELLRQGRNILRSRIRLGTRLRVLFPSSR